MTTAANPDTSWRDAMTREDRIKVCQHIMQKLSTYYQMVPENALREKTSAFESQAYTHAESRTDYLRRIAGGLSNVERQVTQPGTNNANGGGPPSGGAPPAPSTGGALSAATAATASTTAAAAAAAAVAQNEQVRQANAMRSRSKHGSVETKTPNQRTMSSSSSVAGGGSRQTSGQAQLQRQSSFSGLQMPGMSGSDMTPDMLLGGMQVNGNSQQSRFAVQQAQAALATRQQVQTQQRQQQAGMPSPTANPNAAVAGLAMANALKHGNSAAAAAAAAAAVARGQVGAPGLHAAAQFFPGDTRKMSQEQLNQLMSMGMAGAGMPGANATAVPGVLTPGVGLAGGPGAPGLGVSAAMSLGVSSAMGLGANARPQASQAMNAAVLQRIQMQQQQQGLNANATGVGGLDARTVAHAQAQAQAQAQAHARRSDAGYTNRKTEPTPTQVPDANGANGGPPSQAAGANTVEFWDKLEEMKAKYREPLRNMYAFMTVIANSQRPEKKEQFKKHLKDCFQILSLKRGTAVPPTLTTAVLETASKFIDSVISVYKNYMINEARSRRDGGPNSQASRATNPQQALAQQATPQQPHPQTASGQTHPQNGQEFLKLQHQAHAQPAMGAVGAPMSDATKAAAKAAASSQLRNAQLARAQAAQQQRAQQLAHAGKQEQQAQMLLRQQQSLARGQVPPGYNLQRAAAAGADPNRLIRNNIQMQQFAQLQKNAQLRQQQQQQQQRQARQPTLEQRVKQVHDLVQQTVERTKQWETYVEAELKRGKQERIQNTLAALRNVSVAGQKRPASLVDVHNAPTSYANGVIKAKPVFECSSEQGLRLAKRQKNDSADLKALRDAVEADCTAAKRRNALIDVELTEEFGQPLVVCQLLIPEIRLPKLVLRVQRGYPRKGGATYAFERPPLGWVGVLADIKDRFKKAVANAPATSVGVAALLDAWAREAEEAVQEQLRSDGEEEEEIAAPAPLEHDGDVMLASGDGNVET